MKYCLMCIEVVLLLSLIGCSEHGNDKIETDNIKENNPLIVPPCLR
jgi:hypothetical protein